MSMKTTNIKGKNYVEVKERLKYFRANFPEYRLLSEIIHRDEKEIIMKASVVSPSGDVVANGIAHEVAGSSNINKSSHIENCETSAWGRALGNFGIGIDESVASADELINKERVDSEREKINDEQVRHLQSLSEKCVGIANMANKTFGGFSMIPEHRYIAFMNWAEAEAAKCTK